MTKKAFDKIAEGLSEAVAVTRIAAVLWEVSNGPWELAPDEARAVCVRESAATLKALGLTPSAASALMDGVATVVPVELSPEMLELADEANGDDWTAETDPMFISETTRRIYSAAIAASPYRRENND